MKLMWRDPFEAMMPRFEFLTPNTFWVDMYESEDKLYYVIEATLPGFKPEELHITALGDTLTISAVKKDDEKHYVRRERYPAEMTRTFTLPTVVDVEKIEAVFEYGMLKLSIPKVEEVKLKEIPIKVKELAGVG